MRKKVPLDRAAKPNQLMANMLRWKFSVLATAAVVASTGFYGSNAHALALGRITVQSALGEPLRAEIDLPQITAAEADALRTTTATPEVFRAQGMEYTPAINGLQIQLQRRPDGTAMLRLSSSRPVNEPFIDLVLDANWGTGRIVRSYTMLFDPPAMRRPAPAVTAQPQITAPIARAPAAPRTADIGTSATTPRTPAATRPAPTDGVTVQPGDTAGRLAAAYKPSGVSLDQMLVAMMRANPNAFIQGNVNRLKAGAVVQMPTEEAAQAVSTGEARQILAAQSRDFNEFRRKLAGSAPSTEIAAADRSATGTVQTRIEDNKPTTGASNKLTLSKGSKGQKAAEDQVARDKQAKESAARMAELSQNINDLNKLSSTPASSSVPATAGPAVAASAAGSSPVSVPGVPATPTVSEPPAAVSPASDPASTPAPGASDAVAPVEAASEPASAPAEAPAPVPASAPVPAPAAPAPAEEPGFIAGLLENLRWA